MQVCRGAHVHAQPAPVRVCRTLTHAQATSREAPEARSVRSRATKTGLGFTPYWVAALFVASRPEVPRMLAASPLALFIAGSVALVAMGLLLMSFLFRTKLRPPRLLKSTKGGFYRWLTRFRRNIAAQQRIAKARGEEKARAYNEAVERAARNGKRAPEFYIGGFSDQGKNALVQHSVADLCALRAQSVYRERKSSRMSDTCSHAQGCAWRLFTPSTVQPCVAGIDRNYGVAV
eukprot:TRINITY_DN3513_c0_g2_i1.p2 TRINITY_DN3513_c0_g2~~TRINITY_DN3513_c0_g2_i1.p2  ORF type:complete len:233 (-),score=10.80 TRINITY_DN3513_c0_g2_i1:303-1001(-)